MSDTIIFLYPRGDRLGSHIIQYIFSISYAFYHNLPIYYKLNSLKFTDSPFVKSLLDFVNKHNSSLSFERNQVSIQPPNIHEYILDLKVQFNPHSFNYSNDLCLLGQFSCKILQSDISSYFNKYILPLLDLSFLLPLHNSILFKYTSLNFKKTIAVHLRLDDVTNRPDYSGKECSKYYRDLINFDSHILHGIATFDYANLQAPINFTKLNHIISLAQSKYPTHEVVFITSPDCKLQLPFKIITNNDPNEDLYILQKCDVLIMSRSTFAFSASLFGKHSDVWCPLWGHFVCFGLDTKYDYSNFNYF
jgi:hypothetical protein